MVGLTAEHTYLEITPELILRDLDRCKLHVSCGGCRRCTMVWVTSLIAKYGIDAKIAELVPKLYCRTCGWRAPVKVTIERQTGPYRPCGNEPYYF